MATSTSKERDVQEGGRASAEGEIAPTSLSPLRYPPRVLSGIQPTCHLHLGHYFGAIRHQIDLHHEYPFRTFCLIADYHALVRRLPPDEVREGVVSVATAYLAFGLDPVKAVLYRQSDVPAICELSWILSTLTPSAAVMRIPSFKRKNVADQTAGLLAYPILQTADILSVRATIIPAGLDQQLHIELADFLAVRFNKHVGQSLFPPPKVRFSAAPIVLGTDGKKMHVGGANQIELFRRYDYLKARVNSIVTGSAKLGQPLDPETCTVFHLLSLVCDQATLTETRREYQSGAIGYSEAKRRLLHALLDTFAPFEATYHDLKAKPSFVLDVLSDGFRTAKREAAEVLEIVREVIGLRGASRLTGNR
jgi:tryptophanyl-tRNA synthetase